MRIGLERNNTNQEEFNSFEELEASQGNGGSSNKKGLNKMYLMIGAAIIVILIGIMAFMSFLKSQNSEEELDTQDAFAITETPSITEAVVNDVGSLQNTITNEVEANSDLANNENAVLDAEGNVISENGIYDEEGNYITDSENVIKPGINEYTQEGGTTTPIVYDSADFVKDINGVDVSAIYNVKSYNYVYDYVNYEKRRAITDDGMELYWLDITYHNKKYRCTTPFYIFKSLSNEGICRVKLELLTVDGGGKIISYMRVAEPGEGEE